jgi:hypothetical protein
MLNISNIAAMNYFGVLVYREPLSMAKAGVSAPAFRAGTLRHSNEECFFPF